MKANPKLFEFVTSPYTATYSASGQAAVRFEGSVSHIFSINGYRKLCVEVASTTKTKSYSLSMGKLSGPTLGQRIADHQLADAKIHCYDVMGPEAALWLNGTPNSTDKVKLWVYLIP